MAAWTPTDPKTVIARGISRSQMVAGRVEAAIATHWAAASLAAWLEEKALEMDVSDERLAGFFALADMLVPLTMEEEGV